MIAMRKTLSENERNKAAETVALFSVLVHAKVTQNTREASRARIDLERRGVRVRFSSPKQEGTP